MRAAARMVACGAASLVVASGAFAAQTPGEDGEAGSRSGFVPTIDYIARAGLTWSDNLFLAPPGLERSAAAAAIGLEASGRRDTGRLTYGADVNLMYNAYFSHYDSQLFGTAQLDGRYAIAPDSFFWNGMFRYGQVRNDVSRPLYPGNAGDEVTWSTGPEARFRLGRTMEGQVEAHYQSQSFSNSISDSSTVGGRALLAHRSGARSLLAVGASYDDVSYDESLLAAQYDFERQEIFGRFERGGSRTRFSAEAGYASVSGPQVDDSGPLFRGSLSRRITPTVSAFASYMREFPTSSAPYYEQDPAAAPEEVNGYSIVSSAPRVANSFNGGLSMQRTRTEARLTYQWRKEESLVAEYGDRTYDAVRFSVSRRFTPKATGTFFASVSGEEFTEFADDADETQVGAELGIQIGGATGIDLRVAYRDRDAELPENSSQEMTWGLFFRYSGAFGRRPTRAGEDIGLP